MKAKKLTEAGVKAIKPPKSGRDEYPDTDARGLVLRISPAGSKTWAFVYRLPGDINRRVFTIGRYPSYTLKDARRAARAARSTVDKGGDPMTDKRAEREANALARRDTYETIVGEYLTALERKGRKTVRETKRVLLKYPGEWRTWPVKSITKRHVRELLETVYVENGPHQAAALYRALTAFFNWCAGGDIVDYPPIHKTMTPPRDKERNRPLSDEQIAAVWEACEATAYPYGPLVQMLLLTGQRRGEVSGTPWPEIDLRKAEWKLPAERTKAKRAHTIPLPDLAVEILTNLPRFDDGDFVFTANGGSTPFCGFSGPRRALKDAAGVNFKLKDLRATMATVMKRDLGVSEEIVGQCLNHAPGTVTARHYAADHDIKAKRRAFDAWGRHVARLIGRETGKVVKFA